MITCQINLLIAIYLLLFHLSQVLDPLDFTVLKENVWLEILIFKKIHSFVCYRVYNMDFSGILSRG